MSAPSELGIATLAIAALEIGNGEHGKNNAGTDVERYRNQRGPRGAWCAAFISWCLEHGAALLGRSCPVQRSHGARRLWTRCLAVGMRVDRPSPGDIVLWNRGLPGSWKAHIGVVARTEGDSFMSVEGNKGSFPAKVGVFSHRLGESRLVGFVRLP